MERIRRYLTYANVMSTIAIFGVLAGGSAFAASKIGTNQIKNGAVTTEKLHDKAVTKPKLGDAAVTTAKLQGKAVTTGKLSDDAVAPKAKVGMSPVAYASVGNAGTVDPSFTRGLSDTNIVTNPPGSDPGTYCIKEVPGVKTAMVVADTQGGDNHATIRMGEGAVTPNYCGGVPGTQFAVSTFDLVGPADKGFYIWFFN